MFKLLLLMSGLVAITTADPASDQLPNFKNSTSGPIGILRSNNGAPVYAEDLDTLNCNLIDNDYFMESLPHFVRERIPERVVHTKGAGAYGYFEVTHNATDFCKAKLFGEIGKQTPVAVRFSLSSRNNGEADTSRDYRGFAIKFYTEEGNLDLVTVSTPMFFIKDPLLYPSMFKVGKRNPQTNLKDQKAFWDFVALRPETLFFFMYLYSDYGVPDGFRYMPGHSVHTYQVYNKSGDLSFVRFHLTSEKGHRNILRGDGAKIAVSDPDYAIRDLFNAIETGDFPSWKLSVQVLSPEDVKRSKFDPFDITKVLPVKEYPMKALGRLVLNLNPTNYFAEIEQLAFCPGNLVSGISGAPDKIFAARRFSYKDAQRYRLGANFHKIGVNACPFRNSISYERDGVAPVGRNGGNAPNYFPNSYHGPVPVVDKKRPKLIRVKHDKSNNFGQAAVLYAKVLTKDERSRMIKNIVDSLRQADLFVQQRIIEHFEKIHPDLGQRVAEGLAGNSDGSFDDSYLNFW